MTTNWRIWPVHDRQGLWPFMLAPPSPDWWQFGQASVRPLPTKVILTRRGPKTATGGRSASAMQSGGMDFAKYSEQVQGFDRSNCRSWEEGSAMETMNDTSTWTREILRMAYLAAALSAGIAMFWMPDAFG